MGMVEVVIRLPKEVYENIQKIDRIIAGRRNGNTIEFALWNGVKNGTVLPKGHGRLVDADEMVKILKKSEYYKEKRGDFYGADVTSRVKNFIEDTETVIEADKEVENDD